MLRTILQRLAIFIPSLLFATILVFGLVQLIPGGVAASIAGPEATQDQIRALEQQLGLDRPLPVQYIEWLGRVLTGDLGESYVNRVSVADQLWSRVPVTFELAMWALLISLVIGVTSGVVAAVYRGRLADKFVSGASNLGLGVPEFWVGMLSVAVFAVGLGWFPPGGIVPWDQGAFEHLRSMVLPALVLSIGASALFSRITRSSMLEVLSAPYVRTEWASGVRRGTIYSKFALKNVSIPVVTVIGLALGTLLGGTVLVERVFNIPGMGTFIVNSALVKDIPSLQASLLVVVAVVMVVNLLVDLCYGLLDPRTRGRWRA